MSLGEVLKTIRIRARKTLKEQGQFLKVSLNTVYRWENNLAIPRKSYLKAISHKYDIPLEWMLLCIAGGEDIEPLAISLNEVEQDLLEAFRKLSDSNKYKALGYMERMAAEEGQKDGVSNRTNSKNAKFGDDGFIFGDKPGSPAGKVGTCQSNGHHEFNEHLNFMGLSTE